MFSDLRKELTNMLNYYPWRTTKLALCQRLGLRTCHRRARHRRLHLKEGPHAGRHAIQHFYYQRVAPGVETTVWYEESGALVHITWYLETQTVHRFAALPAWLAEDMTVYRGDNQDPAFIEKIKKLISQRQDYPRHILNDEGYFRVI
jgi:hypothetical protein